MAFGAPLTDGYLVGLTANDIIPQFKVVCLDTTTANKVVLTSNANAGPVAGVNEDTGVDTTFNGGVGVAVGVGQALRVAARRYAKVQAKSGEVIAIHVKVYAAAADAGTVTATAASNKFVGYAMEASLGGTADIITVLVHTLGGV